MATTRNPVSLLAFEIGSVTTRAILFDVVEGRYRFLIAAAVLLEKGKTLCLAAARTLLPYEGPERRRSVPLLTLEELERRHIERVLEVGYANRPKAAKILGINVSTIYRKLEKYHLTDKSYESN